MRKTFLTNVESLSDLKRGFRIQIWYNRQKEYMECHFGDFGGKISLCNKRRTFECHLFSSAYIFKVVFFFFFLYFCLWKQSSTVGSGMAISVIAKYFWFPVFQHLIGLQFLTHFNLHGAVWIVLVSKLWVGRRHATSSLTFNVKVRHSRTLFPMASVTCHLYFLGLPYQITTEWVA